MFQNFLVFTFTYAITIFCLYMFDKPEISADSDTASTLANTDGLINTVATTTITYCLSIILKNLFITKRTMYITITSIGLSIIYILIYVSTINDVFEDVVFWASTLVLIGFSLASEIEDLIQANTFENRKQYFKMFSA